MRALGYRRSRRSVRSSGRREPPAVWPGLRVRPRRLVRGQRRGSRTPRAALVGVVALPAVGQAKERLALEDAPARSGMRQLAGGEALVACPCLQPVRDEGTPATSPNRPSPTRCPSAPPAAGGRRRATTQQARPRHPTPPRPARHHPTPPPRPARVAHQRLLLTRRRCRHQLSHPPGPYRPVHPQRAHLLRQQLLGPHRPPQRPQPAQLPNLNQGPRSKAVQGRGSTARRKGESARRHNIEAESSRTTRAHGTPTQPSASRAGLHRTGDLTPVLQHPSRNDLTHTESATSQPS